MLVVDLSVFNVWLADILWLDLLKALSSEDVLYLLGLLVPLSQFLASALCIVTC